MSLQQRIFSTLKLTSLCVNSWRSDLGCSKGWVMVASGVFVVVIGMFCPEPLRFLRSHRTQWGQILSLTSGVSFLSRDPEVPLDHHSFC